LTLIHQMLPNYAYGDGIGNCATQIRQLLHSWGYESKIFAETTDSRLDAIHYAEFSNLDNPWVIYHYSTGSQVNHFILENCNRIILMYHNVTPAKYFAEYDGEATKHCVWGKEQLKPFAKAVKGAWGVSQFNANELNNMGFSSVSVVPPVLNFDNKKLVEGKQETCSGLNDGKTNIIFLGRIVPHKGHDDLIKVFHFYKKYVDDNSRLILLGGGDYSGLYFESLTDLVERLEVPDVVFTGFVNDEELVEYFNLADIFLCLSRHEGFCIPLIEAMRHEIPVVALAEGAVRETLDYAGILLGRVNHHEISELLGILMTDKKLRQSVIDSQNRRANDFTIEKTSKIFKDSLRSIISQSS